MYHRALQGVLSNSMDSNEMFANKHPRRFRKLKKSIAYFTAKTLVDRSFRKPTSARVAVYWASGEKIELAEQSDQLAIKVSEDSSNDVLEKLQHSMACSLIIGCKILSPIMFGGLRKLRQSGRLLPVRLIPTL